MRDVPLAAPGSTPGHAPAPPGRRPRPRIRAGLALQLGLFVGLLGLPDGALGVLWPSLRATFDRPIGDLGVLVLAGTALYAAGSVLTAPGSRRLGRGRYVAASTATAVAGFALWLVAPAWLVVVLAVALTGFARGAIDSAVNADAAFVGGAGALGLVHAAFGVGATAGPLLAAPLLAAGGWRAVVALLAVVAAVALGAATALRGRWAGGAFPAASASAPRRPERAAAPSRRARMVLAATLAVCFTYVGVEAGAGFWAYTLLRESRGMSVAVAGLLTAGYWGGLTIGRLLLAVVGDRRPAAALLHAASLLALAGLAWFWLDPRGLGGAGLPVSGLGLGPVFPLLIALIPRRLGAARADAAIGLAIGAAAIGGPMAVALAGLLANRAGLGVLPAVLVAAAALFAAQEIALARAADTRTSHVAT